MDIKLEDTPDLKYSASNIRDILEMSSFRYSEVEMAKLLGFFDPFKATNHRLKERCGGGVCYDFVASYFARTLTLMAIQTIGEMVTLPRKYLTPKDARPEFEKTIKAARVLASRIETLQRLRLMDGFNEYVKEHYPWSSFLNRDMTIIEIEGLAEGVEAVQTNYDRDFDSFQFKSERELAKSRLAFRLLDLYQSETGITPSNSSTGTAAKMLVAAINPIIDGAGEKGFSKLDSDEKVPGPSRKLEASQHLIQKWLEKSVGQTPKL